MECASNPIPGLSLMHSVDASGVRRVHMKYHDHSLYYQATVLAMVAMATVVVGDTCVQRILGQFAW